MSAWFYRAVDPGGRRLKGVIEASSESAARAILRERKLLPLAVETTRRKPTGTSQGGIGSRDISLGTPRMGLKRLTLVTRQLATLIGAQVRIEEALRIVGSQTRGARDASLLLNLRSAVMDGRSFAAALDDYPATFGDYYRASVRAGETSGRLPEVMEHLAVHIEDQSRNRQALQLALIYPALLALVSLAVIVALLTFVVPDIVRVFTSRGADLPALTRGLIALSDAVSTWGLTVLAVLTAGGVTLALALRRPAMRLVWHRMLAQGWLTRNTVLKLNASRFTGTLATLVQSGVPLADALSAAADTVPNLHIRGKLRDVTRRVTEGAALSRAADASGIFPPMLIAMIASGEAGGTLGASLDRSAAEQSADLKAKVAAVVALVEPAVLLVMGGIVMLLVLSILMPIVSLNNLAG
ncbi:general secretion pathway protein GspF [Oceanicola sp. 22II-s10i]|uniref:type II secretion system F family protein n=1 Tax=Oceanicola sp. 22II-s10i TaxID=1317116 RepID=UPI000B520EA3|nr:type II secretion system F family protein [Oceanicola sp. 22II-s10i]OWU84701.1 general secretion pathway protein GspF [Oceanicola sp. 22II-s10i]